jgi:hypothetical protein
MNPSATLEVSSHYLGAEGEEYFRWQGGGGQFAARIKLHNYAHLIRPEFTVIDFGCGGGFLLNAADCSRKIGIEVNPAARRCATGFGIECHESPAEVEDGVADLIVSDHALEHVP